MTSCQRHTPDKDRESCNEWLLQRKRFSFFSQLKEILNLHSKENIWVPKNTCPIRAAAATELNFPHFAVFFSSNKNPVPSVGVNSTGAAGGLKTAFKKQRPVSIVYFQHVQASNIIASSYKYSNIPSSVPDKSTI